MDIWQDFFKITYHPSPGVYYVHWKESSKPAHDEYFFFEPTARYWIQENFERLMSEKLEEAIWIPST